MNAPPVFLYVEDDQVNRDLMTILIVRILAFPYFTTFENSLNFLPRVEALSPRPNIFFLDIHIRPYDGFELHTMLREHKNFATCTIVAVTASLEPVYIDKVQKSGFNGIIKKPLNITTFPDDLNKLIRGEEVWHML